MLKSLKLVALSLAFSSCVALPKPPNTPMCSFDNASKEDGSYKNPNFKCIAADGTRFQIYWNSPDADKMVATPYKDYVELNAYYKKLLDVFQKQYLDKFGK